ncbi:hypothetical protein ACPCTO_34140 [Streptomyces olivoreticuli]
MESSRPVDALSDRETGAVAAWLQEHPGAEAIWRDRLKAFTKGIRQAAPAALEVADRWHLSPEPLDGRREDLLSAPRVPTAAGRIRVHHGVGHTGDRTSGPDPTTPRGGQQTLRWPGIRRWSARTDRPAGRDGARAAPHRSRVIDRRQPGPRPQAAGR